MYNIGTHVILDAYVENVSRFNKEDLHILFNNLVNNLNMDIIFGPVFKEVELDPSKLTGNIFQDEGGITGMCVISTSHITIHTWELRQFLSMDIFSCKEFDDRIALNVIDKFFQIEKSRVTIVDRFSPKGKMGDFISHNVRIINQNIPTTLGMSR